MRWADALPSPTYSPSPSPTPTPTPSPSPSPYPSSSPSPYPPPPPSGPTGADSSGNSIGGLANQRFNQMITNRVLGTVLLGVNEQVNCSDCISAFGSAGSFSAGIHGRKELTNNLSLLAGIAYTQYSEGGYNITSAPIGAFALRYDFTDWGSSRPFFDVGTILTPWEKARYTRNYNTSLGPVSVTSSTNASNYAVYGRAGWMSRCPRATRSRPRSKSGSSGSASPAIRTAPWRSIRSTPHCDRHRPHQPGQDRRPVDAPLRQQHRSQYQWRLGAVLRQPWRIVATVTGDGLVVPTMGNQGWFEYGGRLGFRVQKGWIVDLFANGTLGPQPVGNTIHGGVGLRINY